MRSSPLLLCLLLTAMPAWGQDRLSPEGTWVAAEARRLVQSGESGDPGCFLQVSEGGRVVEESCSEIPFHWPSPSVSRTGRAIEIRSVGADAIRRLVLRPGAPSEIEVMVERGGEQEFYRLYRLDDASLPALRSLALVRDRLIGEWETEDKVPLQVRADGRYVFGGDTGRYRAEGGFRTAGGAWGALFLEPETGGPIRRYLLHGREERLGLAEVPRDVELLLPSQHAVEEEGEAPSAEEEVVIEGIAIPLPGGSAAEMPLPVLPPGVEEPMVRIWFERARPSSEVEEVHVEEEEPVEEEVPAIAQPIRPARSCGCGAGEAGVALGLAIPWLWLTSRRK